MGLGDGLRALAMQHLAQGGSADELHEELNNLTPPGLGGMSDPGGRVPMSFQDMARANPTAVTEPAAAAVPKAADPYAGMVNDPLHPGAFVGMAADQSPAAPPAAGLPAIASTAQIPPMAPEPNAGRSLAQLAMSGGVNGSVRMPMDAPNPYYGAMNKALGRSDAAEQGALAATKRYGEGLDAEGLGKAEELRIRGLQAQAEQPIRDQTALEAEQHANRTQALQAAFQQKIDTQMGKYQAAAEEASQAQVHNFFENKTTGASIMAIISQALAGAANGLSGNPGAMTPLDRVIAEDMDRQKTNIELKGRNADRQGNMLRTLRDELGSQTLAENAYYAATLGKAEAMLKQLAPHYAGGINSAQAQQAMGALQQKKAALETQTQQHIAQMETTKGDALSHSAEGFDSRQMALAIAGSKQKGKEQQDFAVRGFVNTVPHVHADKAATTSKKFYSIQESLNQYERAVKEGASLGSYEKLDAAENSLRQALHDNQIIRPSQMHEFMQGLTPRTSNGLFNYADAKGFLHERRKALAALYREEMIPFNPRSQANPDGLQADYSDPVMGPLWQEVDSDRNKQDQLQSERK